MRETILFPGDIVLCGSPAGKEGVVSNAILARQRRPGEGASEFSHVGIVGRGGPVTQVTIIEQTWPKLREVSLAKEYRNARLRVYRLRGLTWKQRQEIAESLRARIGERYGTLRIAAFLVDSFISDAASFIFRRPIEIKFLTRLHIFGRWVCSETIAQAYSPYVKFINGSRLERMINGAVGLLFVPLALVSRLIHRFWNLLRRRRADRILTSGRGVTPDDIADFCFANPERMTNVFFTDGLLKQAS